ncbi:MAG: PilZ domain-containing protein [Planctomycetales bacterium]|nr:PilZ domain-containing protein [Planctomycetales bacterium]
MSRQDAAGAVRQQDRTTTEDVARFTIALRDDVSGACDRELADVNRRKNTRVEYSGEVRICPSDSSGVPIGRSWLERGRDISLWGISVIATQPLEVGSHLTMEFMNHARDSDRPVTMLAEVRHARRTDGKKTILGCAFIETLCC